MYQLLLPSFSLQSYVNCALGIQKIGAVLICFGSVNAISAVCIGHVVKHVKRYPTMLSAAFFNTGLFMVLLWWRPCRQDVAMFYVIAACLGLCDAIWQTQTNSRFLFSFTFSPLHLCAGSNHDMPMFSVFWHRCCHLVSCHILLPQDSPY